MVCTHSYMDFRHRANDHPPIIQPPEKLGYKDDSKGFIQGPSEKGKGTRSPEHIGSVGVVSGDGAKRKRMGGEESIWD